MSVHLQKENEFKTKQCVEMDMLQEQKEVCNNGSREPTAKLSNDNYSISKTDLSVALRDTKKKTQFWENEFLQTIIENTEILSFFGASDFKEGGLSICEELQGRIEGLDNAITFLTERNETLASLINEKDQKLVDALQENLVLQNQLKSTDHYLRETVMRASAEKSMMAQRMGVRLGSPILSRQNRRIPQPRGYAVAPGPLTQSNSCTTINMNKNGEPSTLCRKKSDWLKNYTAENDKNKHTKMRDYARVRLREITLSPESRFGQSPRRKKSQKVTEREPGLGSWEDPKDLCSEFKKSRRAIVRL